MKSVVTLLIVAGLSYGNPANAQRTSEGNPEDHNQDLSPQSFFLINNDGGITGITSVPSFQCNYSIAPAVVIENFGSEVLTTATLQYFIDGGTPEFYYWQGALPPFWMDTIVLPQMNVLSGGHTLHILVTEANGEADINGDNNGSIEFNIVGASQPVPFITGFDQPSLPDGFFVGNPNAGPTWNVVTLGDEYMMEHCVRMPFYSNDVDGDVDNLYMKNIDLSTEVQAVLSFDVAYACYSDYYWDGLNVEVSLDCGNNWDVVYSKEKDDLATAPVTDVYFIPSVSQWRNEAVDLSVYAGNSNVILRFKALNGHGNNLYVDDVSINSNVGIGGVATGKNDLHLYPNPASTFVNVSFPEKSFEGNEIRVINLLGQQVYVDAIRGIGQATIPVMQLAPGSYIVSILSKDVYVSSAPLIVSH